MNTSKIALGAATLALSLGAGMASAAQLNIDTLVFKSNAPISATAHMAVKGPTQLDIDTLIVKTPSNSTKSRAEIRSEISMSPKSKNFYF
jgi:hypothetical protein